MRWLVPTVVAAGVLAACGSETGASRHVAWQGPPVVVRQPELPDDVIVSGKLRNESDSTLKLDVAEARVVDSDGHPLRATVSFSAGFSHSLYPPRDAPREHPLAERERLGQAATIAPGDAVPLTVAWRTPPGGPQPVRVDLHGASLELPFR